MYQWFFNFSSRHLITVEICKTSQGDNTLPTFNNITLLELTRDKNFALLYFAYYPGDVKVKRQLRWKPMYDEKTIQLDQFMKVIGIAQSGGHAKQLIQSGQVFVNDEAETRRGRQLMANDKIVYEGETYVVPAIE